jgi:hypothetical protein
VGAVKISKKGEHRLLDRKRICGEGSANHSRARVDPSKCEHIDNTSIRGTSPIISNSRKGSFDFRVVGVADGGDAHAYAVDKLARHETANTLLSSKAVLAAY